MAADPRTLHAAFLEEVERSLSALESGMIRLEQTGADQGVLREVMRHAHTLKGSARLLGATAVHALACQLEAALQEQMTPPRIDSVLQLRDQVRSAAQEFVNDQTPSPTHPPRGTRHESRPTRHASDTADEYLRIPLSRVNALLHLIGELVSNNIRSSHTVSAVRRFSKAMRRMEKTVLDTGESQHLIPLCQALHADATQLAEQMHDAHLHMDPVVDALQRKMKELRMLPCSTVFDGLARTARDVARTLGKQVRVQIEGGDTELDKKVLESLRGPLVHVIRNAIDHGIELPADRARVGKPAMGTITVSARGQGDRVIVAIHDDGRGLDVAAIQRKALALQLVTSADLTIMNVQAVLNLIFAPGLSTATQTTELSGRGVGLDVVYTALRDLRGEARVHADPGRGTTIELILPLTISVQRVLMVDVAGTRWAIPLLSVEETVPYNAALSTLASPSVQVRDDTIPVVALASVLHLAPPPSTHGVVLVITARHRRIGLLVDRVIGEEELFLKGLGAYVGNIDGVQGAAMLPSGQIVIVLDPPALVDRVVEQQPAVSTAAVAVTPAVPRKRILIVDDSAVTRTWEKQVLVAAGYDVETAVDGCDAIAHLQQQAFDVVVTDVQMPHMDGVALYEQMQAQHTLAPTPVIFVTALAEVEMARRMRNIRQPQVLRKRGLDPQQLVEMVAKAIR